MRHARSQPNSIDWWRYFNVRVYTSDVNKGRLDGLCGDFNGTSPMTFDQRMSWKINNTVDLTSVCRHKRALSHWATPPFLSRFLAIQTCPLLLPIHSFLRVFSCASAIMVDSGDNNACHHGHILQLARESPRPRARLRSAKRRPAHSRTTATRTRPTRTLLTLTSTPNAPTPTALPLRPDPAPRPATVLVCHGKRRKGR
jgi:hypothetical protein